MKLIIRVINQNRIKDYEISPENRMFQEHNFKITLSSQGLNFWSAYPILKNGKVENSGSVDVGDVYVLDKERHIAVLILEDVPLNQRALPVQEIIKVGRTADNQLMLRDKMISSAHCVIRQTGGRNYIQDQGSTNGTYVNDVLIKKLQAVELQYGDEIKIGKYTFRVESQIVLKNADGGVVFTEPATTASRIDNGMSSGVNAFQTRQKMVYARPHPKRYPWFSKSPRLLGQMPTLDLEIEAAPSSASMPNMGMMGLAMDVKMMAFTLGMQALRYGLAKKKYNKQEQARAEMYAKYLAGIEQKLMEHGIAQKKYAERLYPTIDECLGRCMNQSAALWERSLGDSDFLSLRVGTGKQESTARVTTPALRLQLNEDEFAHVPKQIADKYKYIEDMPVTVNLLTDDVCGVLGDRESAIKLVQNMVVQIAALHSYDEVKMIVVFPQNEYKKWAWMRWLPHCANNERDIRYIACEKGGTKEILKQVEKEIENRIRTVNEWSFGKSAQNLPHYVFVVADPSLLEGSIVGNAMLMNKPEIGVHGIILGRNLSEFPHSIRNIVYAAQNTVTVKKAGNEFISKAEGSAVSLEKYESFSRMMAPIRLYSSGATQAKGLPSAISLMEGLHLRETKQIDLYDYWREARPEDTMAVPIGIKDGGDTFVFDIHSERQGPHGIIAGGTGSGKSKMIQTWIASMALQFSPEDVNFVLVDFKGESLLQPFRNLPHLAGSTNNNDPDVRRKFLAIESEMKRRMLLLAKYRCDDIIKYRKQRRMHPEMEAMPFLFLIVDEYADFKTQYPEFTAPIDHLYQAGRALGFFGILMTQKPSGKVTEQMRANLGFRWCLRVDDESDSREILGNGEASHIRNAGRAYIKANDGTYELVQAFYSSAVYEPNKDKNTQSSAQVFALNLNGTVKAALYTAKERSSSVDKATELEAVVNYIADYCRYEKIKAATPIWREALGEVIELEEISGMVCLDGPAAIIGVADDPSNQKQEAFVHSFWKDGNLAVYGMALSGKTVLLQTMMVSLCKRYTPEQVQLYLLECGGYGLRNLEVFPHVGAAAGDDEADNIKKIISLLQDQLAERKKLFRSVGAGSPQAYYEMTGEYIPTIVIMADHLNLLGQVMPDVQNALVALSREGNAYGIYLVCTFAGTSGVNYQLNQSIKNVLALRLADKSDYAGIVGRVTNDVSEMPVGRGFVKTGASPIMFQTAIYGAELTDGNRIKSLRQWAEDYGQTWTGKTPKAIKTTPTQLEYETISDKKLFTLGLDVESADCFELPVDSNLSLLISANNVLSKKEILRSMIRQVKETSSKHVWVLTAEAQSYADLVESEHLLTNEQQLDENIEKIADELRARQGRLKRTPDAVFQPMLIVLDGLKSCISNADEKTVLRLEVFIRLGKGLGIHVVGADLAEDMNYCRYCKSNMLIVRMLDGAKMIIGGAVAGHQLIDTTGIREKQSQPMENDEAYLLSGIDEKEYHIKIITGA